MSFAFRMFLLVMVLALPACSGGAGGGGEPTDSEGPTELTPEQIEYEKNLNKQK